MSIVDIAGDASNAVPTGQQTGQQTPGAETETTDKAVQERLAQLTTGLSPGALGGYVRHFMELLLDNHVTNEIVLGGYLAQLRQALAAKGSKANLRQLRHEFEPAVADRAGPGGEPGAGSEPGARAAGGATRVQSVLADAPVPAEAVIPPGWLLSPGGVSQSPGPQAAPVLSSPLVVTGRLLVLDSDTEFLELRWVRDGRWKLKVVDRAVVANKNKVLELAADGLPVTSNNAADVVQYLADFEAANLAVLPRTRLSRALGWVDGRRGFLWGFTLLQGPDGGPPAAVSPLAVDSGNPGQDAPPVLFQGHDEGDDQLAGGFRRNGSFEAWRAAVEPVLRHPKFRLTLIASLCSPLLEILGVPNPILELCGDTSQGKTAALRGAASVWGLPSEKSGEGVLASWDVTRVGVERSLCTINNLPLILDDTRRCKRKDLITQVVYDVVAGRGGVRGSLSGTQRVGTWSTVLLSSGEESVHAYAEQGGARARVLALWGSPFGEVSAAMGETVKRLGDEVLDHYGHAGPRFVEFMLANRAQWPAWKEWHRRIMRQYLTKAGDNSVAGRMADVLATLVVTGILASRALGMPWLRRSPVRDLWAELIAEAKEADVASRALRSIYDFARMHEAEFHGRAATSAWRDRPAAEYQPPGGWAGRWDPADQPWEFLGFYPPKIKAVLEAAGFEVEAVLRAWRERGWLQLDARANTPRCGSGRTTRGWWRSVARPWRPSTAAGGPRARATPPGWPRPSACSCRARRATTTRRCCSPPARRAS